MSRAQNRMVRLREALRYLAEHQRVGRRLEVWQNVLRRVPLEDEELSLNSKRRPHGESDFLWGTTALVHAGFMTKQNRGEWRLTADGARAARLELDAFTSALNERERDFQREQRRDRALRLATEIVPPDPRSETIRTVAALFVERGLRQLDSVFAPGREVWRSDVVDEVERRFLAQPEVDGDDFLAKLGAQFSSASDDAKLLMAELICWQLLPLQTPGELKKRERVRFLLDQMRYPVTIPREIDEAFRAWSFNPGQAMTGRHTFPTLSIVVRLVGRWVTMPTDAREEFLEVPWAWRDIVARVDGTALPIQRNELLFLVHPGVFGEVVAPDHREAIREAFAGEVQGQMEDDPDALFQQIAIALQQKADGPALFYVEPLVSRWRQKSATQQPEDQDRTLATAPDEDETVERDLFPAVTNDLAAALHMPERWLQDTLDLIERRKQVILYGPPGTGKTFLAQALSKHVTDGTNGETTIVQFHPTYSYEDFFEGFRPVANDESGNLAFNLRKGPLRRLADSAAANPEANYFLVIDEINRGNIAKVFGELYFLLEYRDSEISLLYSDEPFTLPSNIFVIGTMNTADRSIAMLDAAMRRRFAFIELHPERDPVRDVLAGWAATKGLQDDRASLLTRLNAAIADHDAKVGPSFLMRDLDANGLADVWRYEILPLLAEHHYGDGVDLEARYGLAALRHQATPSIADGAEGADTAG